MKNAAATKKGGMAQALPDVCHVPAPPPPAGPGGIPTPFVNVANLATCDRTVGKVLVEKKAVIVAASVVPRSQGDEAGVSNLPTPKGVMSQTNMGKCKFTSHSSKVRFAGKPAVRHTDSTSQAGDHPNSPKGTVVTVSQSLVLIGG